MFIYHGWIEIEHQEYFQKYIDGKIDYSVYRQKLLEITSEIERISEDKFYIKNIDLKVVDGTNGMITVHISGNQNHFTYGIEELLIWIKNKAPMSHGLIYYHNTEDESNDNNYQVLRLAKNQIETLMDNYLSPIDEMVEGRKAENQTHHNTDANKSGENS